MKHFPEKVPTIRKGLVEKKKILKYNVPGDRKGNLSQSTMT